MAASAGRQLRREAALFVTGFLGQRGQQGVPGRLGAAILGLGHRRCRQADRPLQPGRVCGGVDVFEHADGDLGVDRGGVELR